MTKFYLRLKSLKLFLLLVLSVSIIASNPSYCKAEEEDIDIESSVAAERSKLYSTPVEKFAYDAPYMRLGGGLTFGSLISFAGTNDHSIHPGGNPPPNLLNTGAFEGAVVPFAELFGIDLVGPTGFLNVAFGYNHYNKKNAFYAGFEASLDVNFRNTNGYALANLNFMACSVNDITCESGLVPSFIVELKAKIGFSILAKYVRVTTYAAFGPAVNISLGYKYRLIDSSGGGIEFDQYTDRGFQPFFGVTWGGGVTVSSVRLPIGWFIEMTIPTFFEALQSVVDDGSGGGSIGGGIGGLGIAILPRLSTGIQIGF